MMDGLMAALIALVNLAIGTCVGMTGIAGFLLPIFYTGFLGMPASESLALSFSAFVVSSVLGAYGYHKSGNLEIRPVAVMSAGSLLGAVGGVWVNVLIPERAMQLILYLVVLVSGISILLRLRKERRAENACSAGEKRKRKGVGAKTMYGAGGAAFGADSKKAELSPILWFLLGVVTSVVCAASGAGGPILVMPVLTLLGFEARVAVGMSLFNSIFIVVPAAAGYLLHEAGNREIFFLLPFIVATEAAGAIVGSKNAEKISQYTLKLIVAVAAVGISLVKIFL